VEILGLTSRQAEVLKLAVPSVEPSLTTTTGTGMPNRHAGMRGRRIRSLSGSLKARTTTAIMLAPPLQHGTDGLELQG
jgi:hypothetical protein